MRKKLRWKIPRSLLLKNRRLPEEEALASGFRNIAGVDEAGRGPWAGPVVAAAVVLPLKYLCFSISSQSLGVKIDDSKRLSPRQRQAAYLKILEKAKVGIGIVDASCIDEDNIRRATLKAMELAVSELELHPDFVLVDGIDSPRFEVPHRPIIMGDSLSYLIACASIVAKVTRDRMMSFYHRIFPEFGFDRHKGYGTKQHLETLEKIGPCLLHRFSFRPISSLSKKGSEAGEILITDSWADEVDQSEIEAVPA